MKIKNRILTSIIGLTFIIACGDNRQSSHTSHHANHDSAQNEMTKATPSSGNLQLRDENLNAVYQHYTHLTNALVKEDASEARIAANAIEAGAKQVKGGAGLAASAARIVASSDIEKQRSEYAQLSTNMISLVKKSGVGSGEVYVDYCPMAMNDKGAFWLSTNKEIRNPYFGDKMLTCGEIKETVK